MDIQDVLERVLSLSKADACIAIGNRTSSANIRWANNTTTTNGVTEEESLSVISVIGKRVGTVNYNHFPDDKLEDIVRESEAACEGKPEAPDYMELIEGGAAADWSAPATPTDIHVFDAFAPDLASAFERARTADVLTFGYAEHSAGTIWVATSSGLRKRDERAEGKVEVTGKSPDFARSAWAGRATSTFRDIDMGALYDKIEQRLGWSETKIEQPAGHYEVLFEASAAADFGLNAYHDMPAREADEGRSVFSKPGGGNRIGEKLFGDVTLTSDPGDADVGTTPFTVAIGSGSYSSPFDTGLERARTEWVRDGVVQALITPRFWAAKSGTSPAPYIDNLIIPGDGPTLEEMIAQTKRALLVTCLWYIRSVDPQTALETGLTRDGVFLVENGEVKGAVNNFRWNMSPVAVFAQTTQIGRSAPALPRENDEFLLAKAPPIRVDGFNMSSVSEAT